MTAPWSSRKMIHRFPEPCVGGKGRDKQIHHLSFFFCVLLSNHSATFSATAVGRGKNSDLIRWHRCLAWRREWEKEANNRRFINESTLLWRRGDNERISLFCISSGRVRQIFVNISQRWLLMEWELRNYAKPADALGARHAAQEKFSEALEELSWTERSDMHLTRPRRNVSRKISLTSIEKEKQDFEAQLKDELIRSTKILVKASSTPPTEASDAKNISKRFSSHFCLFIHIAWSAKIPPVRSSPKMFLMSCTNPFEYFGRHEHWAAYFATERRCCLGIWHGSANRAQLFSDSLGLVYLVNNSLEWAGKIKRKKKCRGWENFSIKKQIFCLSLFPPVNPANS